MTEPRQQAPARHTSVGSSATSGVSRLAAIAAWVTAGAVTMATFSPIGLRPTTTFGADIERAAAFVMLGALVAIAYPRRWPAVIYGTLGLILSLEALQLVSQDRHGRFSDMAVKSLGALTGLYWGRVVVMLAMRARR